MCDIIFDIACVMLSVMYDVLIWLWHYMCDIILWHHMNNSVMSHELIGPCLHMNNITCDITIVSLFMISHESCHLWHYVLIGFFVMSHLWHYLWYHMSDVTCDITCVNVTMITHGGWFLWRHMTSVICVSSHGFSYMWRHMDHALKMSKLANILVII
jgi:hypothetical protein